jgi:NADPH2 dehydrogenase
MIDQFLQDTCNKRTDAWGGSIEKRAKFGLEVTKAVVGAVGAERTGLRLSPFSPFQGMRMQDPVPQFSYYAGELKKLNLAYLHVVESRIAGNADVEATEKIDFLVLPLSLSHLPFSLLTETILTNNLQIDLWANQSPFLIAGGFRTDSAYRAVDEQYSDKDIAIVIGRYFITNPDLVFRIKNRIEFTPYDRNKFYNVMQEDGYTTWAFSKEFEAESAKL